MATDFKISQAAGQAMMTALGVQIDAGTAAVVNIYSGTPPTSLAGSITGTLLAQLVCTATAFSSVGANGSGVNEVARATFAAIASDSSADATGMATHFRIATQNAGTDVCQGTVGTSAADLILNTVAISAGSQVSITSGLIDLPIGST